MKSVVAIGRSYSKKINLFTLAFRWLSDSNGGNCDEKGKVEHPGYTVKRKRLDADSIFEEKLLFDSGYENPSTDTSGQKTEFFNDSYQHREYSKRYMHEVNMIYGMLLQDGPGYTATAVLNEMQIKVTYFIVKEVLMMILRSINHTNRRRSARLGFNFFMWARDQDGFKHTSASYNTMLKVLADCQELGGMRWIFREMIEEGISVTAWTFNILICSCDRVGMARELAEWFMTSKSFNFRPFKHSFNAILYSLLIVDQYRLIEWVYQQMLQSGHSPDILTYNILLFAKARLDKHDEFGKLFFEIVQSGISPDLHTYNILLHVYGKADNPLKAVKVLRHMDMVGCHPQTLHYTSLIDGLSRAGNLDACKHFFDEMLKKGCELDVVLYTVLITGYVVAGYLDKAKELFNEMMVKGKLPNVYTYNSMIRGLCAAGRFDEALDMLQDMKKRGCHPNFSVYRRLVGNLLTARRHSEAMELLKDMKEEGYSNHVIQNIKGYKR